MKPGNDEGAAGGAAGLQGTNGTTDAPILPDIDAARQARDAADKRFATLRARFALRGFELHIVANDGLAEFCISRWGMTRTARTLAELEAFAVQVGAA